MAAKINWHRYGTKLRHSHAMYTCRLVTSVFFSGAAAAVAVAGARRRSTRSQTVLGNWLSCSWLSVVQLGRPAKRSDRRRPRASVSSRSLSRGPQRNSTTAGSLRRTSASTLSVSSTCHRQRPGTLLSSGGYHSKQIALRKLKVARTRLPSVGFRS